MTKHSKQGKTFFSLFHGGMVQYAVHRSLAGHFSYISYKKGVQLHNSKRCTQVQAAAFLDMSLDLLLDLFKID